MQQGEWGCETDTPIALIFDGEETKRCPRRPIKEDPQRYALVFEQYAAYMKGYLPDEGALLSQGYRFTRTISIVGNAMAEAKVALDERERIKQARKNKAASPT